MATISVTTEIDRPVDEVFAFVADSTNDPPRRIVYEQVEVAGEARTRITQTDETSWNGVFTVLSPLMHFAVRAEPCPSSSPR